MNITEVYGQLEATRKAFLALVTVLAPDKKQEIIERLGSLMIPINPEPTTGLTDRDSSIDPVLLQEGHNKFLEALARILSQYKG